MSKKVLLVDDDLEEIELFRDLLSEIDESIIYHFAVNGKDALAKLTTKGIALPDIIFMDINMPGMNGWECLRRMKATPELSQVPVVMYSTSSRDSDRQMAVQLGARQYVTKHISYRKFREEVEQILRFEFQPLSDHLVQVFSSFFNVFDVLKVTIRRPSV
jgi:CheY-like chemotaxis protein